MFVENVEKEWREKKEKKKGRRKASEERREVKRGR